MKHLLTCFALVCLLAGSVPAVESRKPNVLIFYLDDMAYGDPACYGGKLAPTPHMDSLAKNGVRFTDGYVSACVCNPSRVKSTQAAYEAWAKDLPKPLWSNDRPE